MLGDAAAFPTKSAVLPQTAQVAGQQGSFGGDKLKLGNIEVTLLHTPGHTPGSLCFLCNDQLIAGDTLFISACGRVDLPGGDSTKLYESVTGTLAKLPAKTILYPGHNYDSLKSANLENRKSAKSIYQRQIT